MTLSIRVSPGDWGGSDWRMSRRWCVSGVGIRRFRGGRVGRAAHRADPRRQRLPDGYRPNQSRRRVRRSAERARKVWARLAEQFAHEYCHAIADPGTLEIGQFTWIEGMLCETASLFALRHMAEMWAETPRYPSWRDYSASLAGYRAEHLATPSNCLLLGSGLRLLTGRTCAPVPGRIGPPRGQHDRREAAVARLRGR